MGFETHRQRTKTGIDSQPRTVEVVDQLDVVVVDLPLGEPLQHLVEGHPPFEAGQVGAEAVMQAVAEREVLAVLAVDVEWSGRS